MTARFLAAVSLAVLALSACQREWPRVQSVADRGVNAHYVYHRGWHRVDESMPVGERAGAASYPYAAQAYAHFEIPDNSPGSDYQNDGTLDDYRSMHNDKLLSQHPVYDGEGYLAPGTWTGQPLQPLMTEQQAPLTWKDSSQGKIRADEVSGTAYVMQASAAPTVAVAPAPPTPSPAPHP